MTKIHPTAIVEKGAELDSGVEVGAYSIVGPRLKIGAGTRIMPHVCLDGDTSIGSDCVIFPFASIGSQTQDLKFKGGRTFVKIGDRTTLREYVTVNAGTNEGDVTKVGSGCHIMTYAHVAHQCVVGDDVVMSNSVNLAGHVIVEDGAIISGVTGVHQFVRIGRMSFIGACSKAVKDIPPYMLADGNPAKICGLNTVGMQRRNVPDESRRLLKQAYRIIFREKLSTQQALEKIQATLSPCDEVAHLVAFIAESERGVLK